MRYSSDRGAFAAAQAAMTARWGAGVLARESDPQAYFRRRARAYLGRWEEALRFVKPGATLLDIGGGNLFDALFAKLREHGVAQYHYMDVDPSAVDASREIAARCGFDPALFHQGFNDELPFADATFDAVFSSHCIEHSFDLDRTFLELRRVLKPDGVLTFAVPLGWEPNPEHPYFLGADEWVVLLQDHGFDPRAVQTGCEYPEAGFDFFVAARRLAASHPARRVDPEVFRKDRYVFIPFDDDAITYFGAWDRREGLAIGLDPTCTMRFTVPPGTSEVWPVVGRHDWSGVARCTWAGLSVEVDLFSWFPTVQPFRMGPASPSSEQTQLELRPVRGGMTSHAAQAVVYGAMLRAE